MDRLTYNQIEKLGTEFGLSENAFQTWQISALRNMCNQIREQAIADERERCARVCEEMTTARGGKMNIEWNVPKYPSWDRCARAIRKGTAEECGNTPYDEGPFQIGDPNESYDPSRR